MHAKTKKMNSSLLHHLDRSFRVVGTYVYRHYSFIFPWLQNSRPMKKINAFFRTMRSIKLLLGVD